MTFHIPADRHYEGTHHLWAQRQPDRRVRVGIDSLGLESLGELAYVFLRDTGTEVARGGSLGSLEAAKMTANIVAPVSGVITARNEAVLQDPLLVNESPYDAGWLVEVDAADWTGEAALLVSGDAIPAWAERAAAALQSETGAEG